jgi:Staphylococcal protein of unknown function (DUF960).
MFNNERYMTRGISNDLPLEISIYLWTLIDELKGKVQLDYLQVFKLKSESFENKFKITITHTQEFPEYQEEHICYCDRQIDGKIFVIDDDTHSTMLWSYEY